MSSAKIISVRSVLLSAPYADQTDLEVALHIPSGWRTTGMVEIKLANGIIGLGEGYMAVFAPRVFEKIVDLVAPILIGADPDNLPELCGKLSVVTGYWSLQGAAQHVISAVEIGLHDCRAQLRGLPVWRLLGAESARPLSLYASGGDGLGPDAMRRELDELERLGIDHWKIRARNHQSDKASWCQAEAKRRGIAVSIDMGQNLVVPSQSIAEIQRFLSEIMDRGGTYPVFLEEALGPEEIHRYPELRQTFPQIKIAGGEIVTTALELNQRVDKGCYAIVQPDATVIGGLAPTLEVFAAARPHKVEVYVHCWGGPVGMMANYHAAIAGAGQVAEWPMKSYALREAMVNQPWQILRGKLILSDEPGLGVRLTPEIERRFAFREEAVYHCLPDLSRVPPIVWK